MSVCGKNHVGLWEKSCRFMEKIMSVCGKNYVGLWEKFVGQKTSPKNTRTYTEKKIPDYLRLFAEVPRLTTSI